MTCQLCGARVPVCDEDLALMGEDGHVVEVWHWPGARHSLVRRLTPNAPGDEDEA